MSTNKRIVTISLLGIAAVFSLSLPIAIADGQTPQPSDNHVAVDQPRPTPVTRPEMKRLLEDMKLRTERIPLPALTDKDVESPDPRSQSYEGRLGQLFLPASAGARGYLNFSGSPARTASSSSNRAPQEPDPNLTLDYGFKTRLFWIASRANNCQYCLGHQESKLLAVGMSEDRIASLDSDWASFPAQEQASFALARRLTLEPSSLTDADFDACRKHYSDLQILEMVLSVAGNNAINRWKEGVGVPQSTSGGNFGSSNTESHSYLTDTSEPFRAVPSKVIQVDADLTSQLQVPTTFRRKSEIVRTQVGRDTENILEDCSKRSARLPLASEEVTRSSFGEFVSPGKVPAWMRLLANFPVAGKRQVASLLASEKELQLDDLTRARMAWIIARQNQAWYSLSQAQKQLSSMGQSSAQIADLDKILNDLPQNSVNERDLSLLVVAKNLAASPVVLTDAQVAKALQLSSPRDVVQTVHYTAMRSMFDRFTEAARLPAD